MAMSGVKNDEICGESEQIKKTILVFNMIKVYEGGNGIKQI